MKDNYPVRLLLQRLCDISCYFITVLVLALSTHDLEYYGLAFVVIGTFQEYRQRHIYANNPIEDSLLSCSLEVPILNKLAKFRRALVKLNPAIIIVGTLLLSSKLLFSIFN